MCEVMNRVTGLVSIADLHSCVPKLHCTGQCADNCRGIVVTTIERRHIAQATGVVIPPRLGEATPCPALKDGRCTIYEHRPLICDLYGATLNMVCPYGCQPEGGVYLTEVETARLMLRMQVISGEVTPAEEERQLALLADPEAARQVARLMHDNGDVEAAAALRARAREIVRRTVER